MTLTCVRELTLLLCSDVGPDADRDLHLLDRTEWRGVRGKLGMERRECFLPLLVVSQSFTTFFLMYSLCSSALWKDPAVGSSCRNALFLFWEMDAEVPHTEQQISFHRVVISIVYYINFCDWTIHTSMTEKPFCELQVLEGGSAG